jgi:hypothetical protein
MGARFLVPYVLCVRAHLENMSWGGRVYRGDPPACARTGESVTNRRDKTPTAGNLGGGGHRLTGGIVLGIACPCECPVNARKRVDYLACRPAEPILARSI